ncbi:hypothetical protein PM082_020638 [Marasmius tenuissimus]|nr:hypothetical protein PM082_020638 [Marasmius tenuissimus]
MGNNNFNIQINGNGNATIIVGEAGVTPSNGKDLAEDFTNTTSVPQVAAESTQVPEPGLKSNTIVLIVLSVLSLFLSRALTIVQHFVYARLGLHQDNPMERGSVTRGVATSPSPGT